jgi:hypothetical protein|tara:strand:- start:325 stop:492 length:168 start_codon:yes stop_codon:yes gene_type:complete
MTRQHYRVVIRHKDGKEEEVRTPFLAQARKLGEKGEYYAIYKGQWLQEDSIDGEI